MSAYPGHGGGAEGGKDAPVPVPAAEGDASVAVAAAKGDAAVPGVVAAAPAAGDGPTIESVHRDITFANQYRIELIKYLLAIAAALFAFTVAFRPSLNRVDLGWAMWLGWAGLGASMIGGMFHMLGWDHYYKTYRDYDWKLRANPEDAKAKGRAARKEINCWRRIALGFQFGGFMVGVIGVGLFAAANIDNVRKPDEHGSAATQQAPAVPGQQTPPATPPASR